MERGLTLNSERLTLNAQVRGGAFLTTDFTDGTDQFPNDSHIRRRRQKRISGSCAFCAICRHLTRVIRLIRAIREIRG
jgi:hypothetical protein